MVPLDKLRLTSTIIFIGLTFAIIFHSILAMNGAGFPLNTFLFDPADRFMDFFHDYAFTKNLNPYFTSSLSIYFPLNYLVFFPFTWIPPVYSLILSTLLFFIFLFFFFHYFLKNGSIGTLILLTFFTYPVLFCVDRGNVDKLLFMVLGFFIIAWDKKKFYLAATLLAIAIGMKLFPAALILLFLLEKRWKESVFCLTLCFALSILSLATLKGGILPNSIQFLKVMNHFTYTYAIFKLHNEFYYTVSLFSLIKVLVWILPPFSHQVALQSSYVRLLEILLPYYSFSVILLAITLSKNMLTTKRPVWQQVMLMVSMMVLFPPVSANYRLIFFLIPFVLFIRETQQDNYDKLYAIFFGLLFIPKNYLLLDHYMLSVMSLGNIFILLFFNAFILNTPATDRLCYTLNNK